MDTNWIAVYNRFFTIIDRSGTPTYLSGSSFLRIAQQVDDAIPSYLHFIELRNKSGKSTSRKDFYWDVIHAFSEEKKYLFYRVIIDTFESCAKEEMNSLREIVFGGGQAVPTTVVPAKLWSSEKLNLSLKDIDKAIDAQQFNRAVTLAYTCLEGLYKAYVKAHIQQSADVSDLIQLSKLVKDDIFEKLRMTGAFPEQIVNSIPTITHAVANSRNGFSEAHFNEDANKWLALFARDLTNSIGRLLLHFV